MKAKQFNPASYMVELNDSLTNTITEITSNLLFKGDSYKNWAEILKWHKRKLVVLRRILNTDWGLFSNTALARKIIDRAMDEYNTMVRLNLDTIEKINAFQIYKPEWAWLEGSSDEVLLQ